jgi:hypothetical protein
MFPRNNHSLLHTLYLLCVTTLPGVLKKLQESLSLSWISGTYKFAWLQIFCSDRIFKHWLQQSDNIDPGKHESSSSTQHCSCRSMLVYLDRWSLGKTSSCTPFGTCYDRIKRRLYATKDRREMRCSHLLVVHLLLTVIQQHKRITMVQVAIPANRLRSNLVTEFLCSHARLRLVTGYWKNSGHMKMTHPLPVLISDVPLHTKLSMQ